MPANVLEAYPEMTDLVQGLSDEVDTEGGEKVRENRLAEHHVPFRGERSTSADHTIEETPKGPGGGF